MAGAVGITYLSVRNTQPETRNRQHATRQRITMIALLTQRGTIKADHPIREGFASCSSGTFYNKGIAVSPFEDVLEAYGLCFDYHETFGFPGPAGRLVVAIRDEFGVTVGYAMLSWCRMPSGCYEFTGYLA